jgi:hypothetical protein
MLSMPAATRLPVSEFESPKLKTAGNLKCMDCVSGKKIDTKVRKMRIQFLDAIGRGEPCRVMRCVP